MRFPSNISFLEEKKNHSFRFIEALCFFLLKGQLKTRRSFFESPDTQELYSKMNIPVFSVVSPGKLAFLLS